MTAPSAHHLITYTLYRFEICVRDTAVVGVVGAAGLGRLFAENLAAFRFPVVTTLLIASFAASVAAEVAGRRCGTRCGLELAAGRARLGQCLQRTWGAWALFLVLCGARVPHPAYTGGARSPKRRSPVRRTL